METLIKKYHQMPLRKYLVVSVIVTFGVIVLLSAFTIWGCMSFRNYLLPESNNVFLTVNQIYADDSENSYSVRVEVGAEGAELPILIAEDAAYVIPKETTYKIERIENSVSTLSPKRKLAYYFCSAAIVVLPFAYSITGILLCGFQFFKRKLSVPLGLLSEATKQISEQNLDFSLQYDSTDEMGMLCDSFEQMRLALYENYREMWKMLEERKLLQASIAHDLRNPIAIIEGYAEYLQINLESGKLSEKRILKIVENLKLAAKRLEQYTESVRMINQMEDIELHQQNICVSDLISGMEDDFKIMVQNHNIQFSINHLCSNEEIWVDCSVLYRVLENIFSNALRYAKENVTMECLLLDENLSVIIKDDGIGFPEEMLHRWGKLLFTKSNENGHLGMGLAISRILCEKHGGSLEIYNDSGHHAVVKIMLQVTGSESVIKEL